ncbi:uncharacterized protein A1O9_05941 [Exophiala aquamarina CBS 119918]|uniref:2-dehydropantoate 2-reductase n=1 Tax=Exophiala aquamarina CBS 119918 TaxID=1182545 RepID=A0A072PFG2_9EURO|nr:uncharacterized protein A1O9_05941 [Exophiala aquamarina CBS 119918]KEF58018.1 hypothetical protein A1O9_05941 [Exophiala aquamarina CBS 119918]
MTESQSWWSGSPPIDDTTSHPDVADFKPIGQEEIRQPTEEELLTRRIHILGLGSIGTLVAHSLKCLPNPPPITLMIHRDSMYQTYKKQSRTIRLINKQNEVNDEQTGFDVDVLNVREGKQAYWKFIADVPGARGTAPTNPPEPLERLPSGETYIYNLIVTVKGPTTIGALRSIRHRVDANSTICFMQNGLGQIDLLNTQVFTDPKTRPTYMLGIVSHGAYLSGEFAVVHAGFGSIALGIHRDLDRFPLPPKSSNSSLSDISEDQRKINYPTDKELFSNISSRFLLRTLTRSPVLACAAFPYLDLFQLQLEKLSANALLNPITALLNVPNGALMQNPSLSMVQRMLLAEISLVLRGLPELEGIPNVQRRFSAQRLELFVLGVIARTAENSSSMREDVRHSNMTEIDFINGYIISRGEEQGIKCALNFMLMHLVKGKTWIQRGAEAASLPYGTSRMESEVDSRGIVTLDDTSIPAKGKVQ